MSLQVNLIATYKPAKGYLEGLPVGGRRQLRSGPTTSTTYAFWQRSTKGSLRSQPTHVTRTDSRRRDKEDKVERRVQADPEQGAAAAAAHHVVVDLSRPASHPANKPQMHMTLRLPNTIKEESTQLQTSSSQKSQRSPVTPLAASSAIQIVCEPARPTTDSATSNPTAGSRAPEQTGVLIGDAPCEVDIGRQNGDVVMTTPTVVCVEVDGTL